MKLIDEVWINKHTRKDETGKYYYTDYKGKAFIL